MATGSTPTTTTDSSAETGVQERKAPTFGLSPAHVGGTTLAAVTSAVGASTFGVGGTIAGAAFGSVVSTVGGAVYQASLERAGRKLRSGTVVLQRADQASEAAPAPATQALPAQSETRALPSQSETRALPSQSETRALPSQPETRALSAQPETQALQSQPGAQADDETQLLHAVPKPERYDAVVIPAPGPSQPPTLDGTSIWQRIRWKPVAALAGVAFVAGLGFITVSELVLDRPLADASSEGTSVGRVLGGDDGSGTDTPTPSPSDVPSVSPTEESDPVPSADTDPTPTGSPDTEEPETTAPAPTTAVPTVPPSATPAP